MKTRPVENRRGGDPDPILGRAQRGNAEVVSLVDER